MTTLASGPRLGRKTNRGSKEASIREVCLIGEPIPAESVGSGDRIERDGRRYRIEAVEDGGGGDSRRYLHLKMEDCVRSDP